MHEQLNYFIYRGNKGVEDMIGGREEEEKDVID